MAEDIKLSGALQEQNATYSGKSWQFVLSVLSNGKLIIN